MSCSTVGSDTNNNDSILCTVEKEFMECNPNERGLHVFIT